jgi:hypothetical protein
MSSLRCFRCALVVLSTLALAASPAGAAEIYIDNRDDPGEGLNDPSTPPPEMGCPAGMTVGQCRLRALTAAAERWGSLLESDVPTQIVARFNPLVDCTFLGYGAATTWYQDFAGAPIPGTKYPNPLANALAGTDLSPGMWEMDVIFNSSLDSDPACTANWWYGIDGAFPGKFAVNPDPNATHFFAVALKEIAHGLGFSNTVDETNGQLPGGVPDIYLRSTFDTTTGLHWHEMNDSQRVASAVNTGQVVLDGPFIKAAADRFLTGHTINLVVNDGAAAGTYVGMGGAFGASWLFTDGFTAVLEQVNDGAGASPSDACEPLVGFTPGHIAFVDRGNCLFFVKALHAQQAGAYGMVVANHQASPPLVLMGPMELGRQTAISVMMITLADGNLIRTALPASATYDVVDVWGMHANGFPLLYTPSVLELGDSIEHFDTSVFPSSLMEPSVDYDVYDDPDMALGLLQDEGWTLASPNPASSAITQHSGGIEFPSFYGSSTADVVGFRFTVVEAIEVIRLGVWNADTSVGHSGLSAPHHVGIWDPSQSLVASAVVYPATATAIGDWSYTAIPSVVLLPGQTYTIGATYSVDDNDSFVWGAGSMATHPAVVWTGSAYPAGGGLGFTYPAMGSTTLGGFGPNFAFNTGVLFIDGFESGGTSHWSTVVP